MIHNIRAAFNEILEESSWMDDDTKAVAKEKVGWFYTFKVLSSDKSNILTLVLFLNVHESDLKHAANLYKIPK